MGLGANGAYRAGAVGAACLVALCAAAAAEEVRVPGKLEAADAVLVTRRSQTWDSASGTIMEIIPEGSPVKAGDLVFRCDTSELERRIKEAESRVEAMRLGVTKADSGLATLRGELETARAGMPVRLAGAALEVERLRNLPDPVELSAAEAEAAQLEAGFARAREHCAVLESLGEQEAATQIAMVEARFGRDIKAAELERARARLEEVRQGALPCDIEIAETEQETTRLGLELEVAQKEVAVAEAEVGVQSAVRWRQWAEGELGRNQREMELQTRYAPVSGKVVYESIQTGEGTWEKVAQGMQVDLTAPVVSLISGTSFQFRAKASEDLLSRVRAGLPAQVEIEALGGTVLNGHVERFDVEMASRHRPQEVALSDLERPEPKVFDMVIAIEGAPEGLMPGLTGDAVLELGAAAAGSPAPSDGRAQNQGAPAGPPCRGLPCVARIPHASSLPSERYRTRLPLPRQGNSPDGFPFAWALGGASSCLSGLTADFSPTRLGHVLRIDSAPSRGTLLVRYDCERGTGRARGDSAGDGFGHRLARMNADRKHPSFREELTGAAHVVYNGLRDGVAGRAPKSAAAARDIRCLWSHAARLSATAGHNQAPVPCNNYRAEGY